MTPDPATATIERYPPVHKGNLMIQPKLPFLASVALAASFFVLAGCHDDRITAAEIRNNTTPSLAHYARNGEQVKNDHARIIDNNTRGIWDDLDRILLLHENSHLTRHPIP